MGFLSKTFKKITKGVKKVFKGVGKLLKSDVFKVVAIGAAVVFTAGMAATAFPAFGATGFAQALGGNALTSGIFNAGGSLAAGFAGASSAVAGAAPGLATPTLATTAGAGSAAGATGFGASAAGVGTGLGTASATAAPGVFGSLGAGIAKTAGAVTSMSPGTALLAGNVLQSAFAPSEAELLREQDRRRRQNDNRFGINNYSGEGAGTGLAMQGLAPSTQGILSRARQNLADPRNFNQYGA